MSALPRNVAVKLFYVKHFFYRFVLHNPSFCAIPVIGDSAFRASVNAIDEEFTSLPLYLLGQKCTCCFVNENDQCSIIPVNPKKMFYRNIRSRSRILKFPDRCKNRRKLTAPNVPGANKKRAGELTPALIAADPICTRKQTVLSVRKKIEPRYIIVEHKRSNVVGEVILFRILYLDYVHICHFLVGE